MELLCVYIYPTQNISLQPRGRRFYLCSFHPLTLEYTHRNADAHTGLFYNVLCHLFIIQRLVLTPKCFSPYLERSLDRLRNVYTVSSMCICACQCVCVGLCAVCVCVSALCVSVKVCCCSLEVAVSSSDWSLYTKSALYSVVTRGRCGASLRHFLLCLWAFLQERKCVTLCHCEKSLVLPFQSTERISHLLVFFLFLWNRLFQSSVLLHI